ncbi:MAG: VTT domain-containing protein [Acidobacteriota bacterium]
MNRFRQILLWAWVGVIVGALYLYFFDSATLQAIFATVLAQPKPLAGAIFFLILCFRGFTLIPAGYLVIAAIPVLPAIPLFFLTLAGVMVSSASIYLFSEVMRLDEYFERKHKRGIEKVRGALQRYEMPIIIAWSFLPLVPTDVICYVCGTLKVNFKKFLLGILIGEGAICAVYIFAGDTLLRFFSLRS